MIKKALLLLGIPYFAFIYLESCNKPCEHPETRSITGISMEYFNGFSSLQNTLQMRLSYESIFASNNTFNLTNKAMAYSPVYDPCFNRLVNPIDSVSVKSRNPFSSAFPANSELSSLFLVYNENQVRLSDFTYDIDKNNSVYYDDSFMKTSISFINDSLPTMDSIHDLSITIYCRNGDVFSDSLIGINLKSNL